MLSHRGEWRNLRSRNGSRSASAGVTNNLKLMN
jgi:hypothetical protein